jgi:hypothetical protein
LVDFERIELHDPDPGTLFVDVVESGLRYDS